jgi:pimeloyl-ACP methyl ester carboxylesterase
MEVRLWYGEKLHNIANGILDQMEKDFGKKLPVLSQGAPRKRTMSGGSMATAVPYDAHPEAARKPFMFIGEQRLCVFFKPLPVQLVIWLVQLLKLYLLRRWGFICHHVGPVRIWVRTVPGVTHDKLDAPLLFCPGLFLGNAAYLLWIHKGLLPLGKTRPLLLLELPHLSHGLDPGKVAYSLFYSWPRSDEISHAIVHFLERWRPLRPDVVGNSFGTVVMTMLRKRHREVFNKFIYIDPISFIPCYPAPMLAVHAPYLDSYASLFREACKKGGRCPHPKWLLKYLVLRPAIFGDLEVQYVIKRGLYLHEIAEQGELGSESLVIIGEKDELLRDPSDVAAWAQKNWPEASVKLVDCNHGALMGNPMPFARMLADFLNPDTQ